MKTTKRIRLMMPASSVMLASLLWLFPVLTRAETAVEAWVQRYNGPGNSSDSAEAVAVDGSNNVIVTGTSAGSGSAFDYATIKYSSDGVPLWTNRYNGPGNSDDNARAVAVDGSNNVIVTGHSTGSGSGWDYATIKYSSAGVTLWTNRYNGPGNSDDYARAVAADATNNVIVAGYSRGSGTSDDYATIKYSSTGLPLWTNRYNGPGNGNDRAIAVTMDHNNNVIVTGYSTGSESGWDYGTVKYSSAGAPLWTNRYNGPGNSDDRAMAVTVDHNNNVIVTGYSIGSESGWDYGTVKYSSAGVPLWTNRYNGPGNSDDNARAVAVDGSNNVIVTGYSTGSGSGYDFATVKYGLASPPVADFTADLTNGVAPLTVVFTNLSTGATEYGWAFGDGNLSTNIQPANTYTNPGAYSVTLSAVGPGGTNILTRTNYIVVVPPPPVADFTADLTNGVAPLTVIFTNLSTGATEYAWAFGDGNLSTNVQPANTYTNPGVYSVTLNAVGPGGTNTLTRTNYIVVVPPALVLTALDLTNGTFQMLVEGLLQPGTLVIEASTNLAGWSPVFTNTTPTNVLFYTDPKASNFLWRFYRASEQW
ncbi:MAG: PKD domain-containing protein [Verrucomicrobia bacterium]|nr:PKD domain-containing protein [Verrucomicrobiota bacterium]